MKLACIKKFIVAGILGMALLSGCQQGIPPMTHDEFRAATLGKTQDEVIKALGIPYSTSVWSESQQSWTYEKRTYDPITDLIDHYTHVEFKNGRVTDVTFL